MAFIYNLTDNWTNSAATWDGIKLAVTNTASDASSKLLNLTVTGATTASFVVDKSGNLSLNGTVNKITFTAPATGATLTLADNSTFATSGAHSTTLTTTGTTTLTLPTSGTVTALGNTTTGSGSIVLANSPALVTPDLGTPSAATLTNATGLPVSTGISGFGTGVAAALGVNVSSAGAFVVNGGALGTPSSGTLTNCTGYTVGNISGLGSGVATWLATPSSANLAAAVTDETGTGSLVFANSPTLVTPNLGTPSAATLTNATGLPISTGVSGLGAGVATFLATPSSANLRAAVTDETGTGSLVFSNSPTFDDDITLGVSSSTRGELILANTTANTVKLRSSNSTAASYTLTFPAAAPVNGYYLQTDVNGVLSWAAGGGGGGGSPGGSNTQIQFNNLGAFGGDAAFTFVNGTGTATTTLGVASTTSGALKLYNSASANSVTLASGNNTAAWTLTLPTDDGTNGQYLQTDGSGNTTWATISGTGDVVGPASATDNAVVRFDGTTGKLVQNSAVTIADTTGDITGGKYNGLTISTTTGTLSVANGKTLAVDNTLTFVGTDSSTVSFGAGGTVLYNGGALGTPSSGTLTNCTGLPIATGVSGLGTGVATFLATPSSANLAAAVTNETGSGALVFATSPTLVTPVLGTPTSGTLTNCTGLPVGGLSATGTPSATTYLRGDGSWTAPNNQATTITQTIYTSGSGTYTVPAGVRWLRVRMVGGGGGGGGSGASPGSGVAGGTTTFGSSFLTANGGAGGSGGGGTGSVGGTASIGAGASGVALQGGGSGPGSFIGSGVVFQNGGHGGDSAFGGGAGGTYINSAGLSGVANTGGGGAGGGTASGTPNIGASGGGAGGYIDCIIASPSSSYAYAVAAGGAGGTGGTNGSAGGAGGSGVIIIEEHYNW